MKNFPKYTISAESAMDLILQGKPIQDTYIIGDLDLYEIRGKLAAGIMLENCAVANLISHSVDFKHPFRLESCVIYKCSFNYAYFMRGLTIDSCIFENYVDFQAGGHNQPGCPFEVNNTQFRNFVNFLDCWFQGEVVIENNEFEAGSNLLGNQGEPYSAQFDIQPRIENNRGPVDLDGEGPRFVNTIDLR